MQYALLVLSYASLIGGIVGAGYFWPQGVVVDDQAYVLPIVYLLGGIVQWIFFGAFAKLLEEVMRIRKFFVPDQETFGPHDPTQGHD